MAEQESRKTDYLAMLAIIAAGIAGGYLLTLLLQNGGVETFLSLENVTYEKRSFASEKIVKYDVTIDTQLPQVLKNPIWRTPIKIYIDENDARKRRLADRPLQGLRKAMSTLENETGGLIKFQEVGSAAEADLVVNFTFNVSEDDLHDEAVGKAGPTLYVRAGEFTLIKKAEMYVIPVEYECTSYTLAMHELGHVLGFGHSAARNSVMWPRFGCLTNNVSEIVHDVKEIYKNYKPDLAVSSAAASMQGAAVKVEADIINEGPKLAENVTLAIYINGKQAHAEKAGDIDTGYALKATSLLPTRQRIDEIKVEARYDGDELTKENNVVVLKAE